MKRPVAIYCILLFALMMVNEGMSAQDVPVNPAHERIQACTDRTMYVSGEKILFSAVICNANDGAAEEISRIFYCELIMPDGKRITGGKYLLQNDCGQGCLAIPEETISGVYFLKFYTRFMRNGGTEEYKYIMLKIINPFKTEVLPGKDVIDTAHVSTGKVENHAGDRSLNFMTGKKVFAPREEIRLNVGKNPGYWSPARLCLSVVLEFTSEDAFLIDQKKLNTARNGVYLPETRGISLSGQLVGKGIGKPVPGAKVNLSIIGDKDILVVRTDSSGRFFFALPDYTGKRDLFLCADDLPVITSEILIDNDFCSRPVNLPSPVFRLSENEKKSAYKLAVNSRISSLFRKDTLTSDTTEKTINVSFYGAPSEILVIDKYIDLPTLGDYFSELPVIVKLRKVQGKRQFRFILSEAETSMYDPLVLVDWVAVDDIEKILAMSPQEIDRVELVNSPYVKGNITFGGIISFVSKKNDFAGIDLPTSGTFVNYTFLENCSVNMSFAVTPANIPDSRNTIYWDPAVPANDDGTASISFPAPDTPGRYLVILRGISKKGEIISSEESFVISE